MAFDLLKIGLFKFPPFWAKIVFKCPTQVPDFSFQNLYIKRLKHMYSARKTWQLVQVSHPPRHQVQIGKVQIPHHQGIDYTQTPMGCPKGERDVKA